MAVRNPLWFDTATNLGHLRPFGLTDTLELNVNAGVSPLNLDINGTDVLTVLATGVTRSSGGYVTAVDGVGTVGAQYTFRPASVNASTSVNAGAVFGVGAGTRITLNTITLGHANVNKYIDADQGTFTPYISYNATAASWRFSNNGSTWTNLGEIGAYNFKITSYRAFVTLDLINNWTAIGLTPNGVILGAAIRVSTQITGLSAGDIHTISLGTVGTPAKYCTATQGAPATTIDVNKKNHYIDLNTTGETDALRLTIAVGAGTVPTAGAVEVEVHYIQQSAIPDV